MKRETISLSLSELDDRYITEAETFAPGAAQAPPERKRRMKPKRILALSLAAAAILSLGVIAYAVGSIHATRQEELRGELQIEESGTASYVEYEVGAEPAEGVTVLAAINDGQAQKVYVNISPVEAEKLPGASPSRSYRWTLEGTDVWGLATPQMPADLTLRSEEIYDAVKKYAYDGETKTLTMVCYVDTELLSRALTGGDRATLHLSVWMGGEEISSFGTAEICATQEDARVFDLGSSFYRSEQLDKEIELVELKLTPVSAVWRVHYEGDEAIHAARDQEALNEWGAVEDEVCINAQIIFSDGTSFSTGGVVSNPYEDGAVSCFTSWNRAINVDAVERIVLGDLVLWAKP